MYDMKFDVWVQFGNVLLYKQSRREPFATVYSHEIRSIDIQILTSPWLTAPTKWRRNTHTNCTFCRNCQESQQKSETTTKNATVRQRKIQKHTVRKKEREEAEKENKTMWKKTYFAIANASVQHFFDWEFFFGGIAFRHVGARFLFFTVLKSHCSGVLNWWWYL